MAASTEAAGANMETNKSVGGFWRRGGYNAPSYTSRGCASGTTGAGNSQRGGEAKVMETLLGRYELPLFVRA